MRYGGEALGLIYGGYRGFDPAAPGAIGGTTPAAITGTTITATTAFVAGSSSDAFLTRYAAKQISITGDGTGATTNAGWILGYGGSSTISRVWSSTVTPGDTNWVLGADGDSGFVNGPADFGVYVNNVKKTEWANTAGAGPLVSAGTATSDVNALSLTQTWNGGAVAFKGIRQVITNTASAATSADLSLERSNGQGIQFATLSELTTIAAAATTDTTIQMPAGAVILGVSVRVTTVIPTATTFTVGDSGSAARFSTAAVSVAANSVDAGTKAGAYYNASALSVRITPNGTPANNTGRVRVTIHYYTVTPPTS